MNKERRWGRHQPAGDAEADDAAAAERLLTRGMRVRVAAEQPVTVPVVPVAALGGVVVVRPVVVRPVVVRPVVVRPVVLT